MKSHGVAAELGKRMARISEERVWQQYGRLTETQAAAQLRANTPLQDLWVSMYEHGGQD